MTETNPALHAALLREHERGAALRDAARTLERARVRSEQSEARIALAFAHSAWGQAVAEVESLLGEPA